MDIFSSQWDEHALNERQSTWAFLDTGATENAIGEECLHEMLEARKFTYNVDVMDRPVFRFGNGQKDQARSKVILQQTALGDIPFYVWGGEGRSTPPLIGARTLRDRKTLLSYGDGTFLYSGDQDMSFTIPLHAMKSRHVAVDLCDEPAKLDLNPSLSENYVTRNLGEPLPEEEGHVEQSINMMWCEEEFSEKPHSNDEPQVDVVLETLAERLGKLRSSELLRDPNVDSGSFSMRRPEEDRVSVRGASQSRNPESQPVRFLGKLVKMRSAVGLSKQEGLHGRESPHGSRTSLGQDCPGEPSGGHTPTVVHREGRDGEGHGGQGQDASTGFDTKDGHQPDLCPLQGAIGEDGFHRERSGTRALEDAGEINHTRSDHHGRGCGEEHPEDGEAGADRGELRPEAEIEEGRGESREVEGHGADSQGQVTGQAKDTSEGCEEDQEGGGVGIKLTRSSGPRRRKSRRNNEGAQGSTSKIEAEDERCWRHHG